MMTLSRSLIFVFLILLIDQWSKVYIKTNFYLYESYKVFGQEWFQIYFIENEGMAWGTKLPGDYGKLALTIFRIIAVFGISFWLFDSIKKKASQLLIFAICLILAGAIGNIVDSVFYGLIFDHSEGQVATLFSDKPYGEIFYGKVVDMFYFPLFEFTWPDWMPYLAGKQFRFFNAIFNVADFVISTGIGILLVFNKRVFKN
jgi:signal peptidase II